jgi:TonB family protein
MRSIRGQCCKVLALSLFAASCLAAGHDNEVKRKIVTAAHPTYPQVARAMRLVGTVKIEVTVSPDGKPKQMEVKGGHPVLAKAATDAIEQWRWKSGRTETKELVELEFAPYSQ